MLVLRGSFHRVEHVLLALSTVFLVATFLLLIAFVVSFFLPPVELRTSSAYPDRGNDEAAAAAAAVSARALLPQPASAQAKDPERPIRMVIPFQPGGAAAPSATPGT